MTYKENRKIKTNILIVLVVFIFLNSFQILLKTRTLSKTPDKACFLPFFLSKNRKTDVKPNQRRGFLAFLAKNDALLKLNQNYKEEKQTRSSSSCDSETDRCFFIGKRLIKKLFRSFSLVLNSVIYRVFDVKKLLLALREHFLKLLEELVFPRGLSLAKGLLLGDISSIPQELYHSFKVIGILHLLSASSYNLSIFLLFFRPILLFFRYFFSGKIVFLSYLSVILFYFSLVGEAISIKRASFLMVFYYLSVFFLKRAYFPLYSLFLIGFLLLSINPFYIFSLGFQFSFLASLGIYYFKKRIVASLKKTGAGLFFKAFIYFMESFLFSVAAQFFLFSLFIAYFSELNYLAIFANFFFSPLVELLTIAFLFLFFSSFLAKFYLNFEFLNLFNHFLSDLISEVMNILFKILHFFEKIPIKNINFKNEKDWWVVIFVATTLFIIIFLNNRKNKGLSKSKYRIYK